MTEIRADWQTAETTLFLAQKPGEEVKAWPLGVEDQAEGPWRWEVGEVGEEHPRKY